MGCKHSKSAVRDESPEYKDSHDRYEGETPTDIDAVMYGRNGIETEIIPTHRYDDGYGSGSQALAPLPANQGYCNDQHFTKMAEGCTSGILEMFQFSNSKKITNGPPKVSAYQRPAHNYQTDNSIGHNSQTSSQRRLMIAQQGSFQL